MAALVFEFLDLALVHLRFLRRSLRSLLSIQKILLFERHLPFEIISLHKLLALLPHMLRQDRHGMVLVEVFDSSFAKSFVGLQFEKPFCLGFDFL